MHSSTFLALALAPLLALAKTDLSGCTSTAIGNSLTWYVPGTGELCSILDCGGGRAPPMTTVPGCAAYSGTATYQPSYMAGWGPNGQSAAETTATETGAKPTGTGAWSTTSGEVTKAATATGGASSYITLSASANGTLAATATATPSPFSGTNGADVVGRNGALAILGGAVAAMLM